MTPELSTFSSTRKKMQKVFGIVLFVVLTVNLTANSYESMAEVNGISQPVNSQYSEDIIAKSYAEPATSAGKIKKFDSANRNHRGLRSKITPEESVLLIQTEEGLTQVVLSSRKISVDIPFPSYYAQLQIIPSPNVQTVTMNNSPIRILNYTLGLGANLVDIGLVRGNNFSAEILKREDNSQHSRHHTVSLHRLDRTLVSLSTVELCYLKQDCDLKIYSDGECGVNVLTPHWQNQRNHKGYWRLRCGSCQIEQSCLWLEAEWIEPGNVQPANKLTQKQIENCLHDHQLMFLGDSTNRGVMQSVMEEVNSTLYSAVKSHDFIHHQDVGNSTNFSFLYYPAFWLKSRPTFVQALHSLLSKSKAASDREKIILVIGGVQWLTKSQLIEINKVAKERGIPSHNVYIKTHSSGFHVDVPGIPLLHNKNSMMKLIKRNDELVRLAHTYGFNVIDTLRMTLSRFKEFLQGKCACHFHQVHSQTTKDILLQKTTQTRVFSKLYNLGLVELTTPTLYHISGNIHNAYTNMLISRMCPQI